MRFWVGKYGAHAARVRTRTHHLHAMNDEEGHSHPVQISLAKPELPHCCPADTHIYTCKKRKRERGRERGIYIYLERERQRDFERGERDVENA